MSDSERYFADLRHLLGQDQSEAQRKAAEEKRVADEKEAEKKAFLEGGGNKTDRLAGAKAFLDAVNQEFYHSKAKIGYYFWPTISEYSYTQHHEGGSRAVRQISPHSYGSGTPAQWEYESYDPYDTTEYAKGDFLGWVLYPPGYKKPYFAVGTFSHGGIHDPEFYGASPVTQITYETYSPDINTLHGMDQTGFSVPLKGLSDGAFAQQAQAQIRQQFTSFLRKNPA